MPWQARLSGDGVEDYGGGLDGMILRERVSEVDGGRVCCFYFYMVESA